MTQCPTCASTLDADGEWQQCVGIHQPAQQSGQSTRPARRRPRAGHCDPLPTGIKPKDVLVDSVRNE